MEIKRAGSQPSGKVRQSISRVRCASIPVRLFPNRRADASVTFELGAHRVAHSSARSDFDRHIRRRLDPVLG